MKKHRITFSLLLCMVIGLVLCSCNESERVEEQPRDAINDLYISRIYEIDTGIQHDPAFNHKNVISHRAVYSISDDVQDWVTVCINDSNEQLQYHETVFYPVTGKRVHKYFVDGDETKKVLLSEDGSVNSLLYDFAKIKISKYDEAEIVKPLLEELVKEYVDLTLYGNVDISDSSNSDGSFGYYEFLYYNSEDGYMTDYAKIYINDEGYVYAFSINDMGEYDEEIKVNRELEEKMLHLKFRDIYNTNTSIYNESYTIVLIPYAVVYNGEVYICYPVSADYTEAAFGEIVEFSSPLHRLLIPLDLIKA